ncbi:MAG TPA: hypothetical protein VF665_18420 [Longimicrobium sp.]|uniref:hypothetical protein n=1 Tax=Longimicrobium sp. TaxID=2029185 RepID=UPI002ED95B42
MSDVSPESEAAGDEPEIDWDARRKRLEEEGILVRGHESKTPIDWDALEFLPFTADEVSAMFMELRNTGKL